MSHTRASSRLRIFKLRGKGIMYFTYPQKVLVHNYAPARCPHQHYQGKGCLINLNPRIFDIFFLIWSGSCLANSGLHVLHNTTKHLDDGLVPNKWVAFQKIGKLYLLVKSSHHITQVLPINMKSRNWRRLFFIWHLVPWDAIKSYCNVV